MKETMRIITIFALVLVLLLVCVWVIGQISGPGPAETAVQETAPAKDISPANEMNEESAAVITLEGSTASVRGLGAQASEDGVRIVYPGTYRLTGSLDDGTVTVDLGSYTGAAYLILDGASVSSTTGPAIHVVQADLTVIHLADGSWNTLSDGSDYTIVTAGEPHTGAALYSADALVIEGSGALEITGSAADGIRAKDTLSVTGGSLNITAADDGIQVNDTLTIAGGSLLIGAGGDGISVTQGSAAVTGGSLWIHSAGDVLSAAADITVSGGSLIATAADGSEEYARIALGGISAKGLKADTVTVSAGQLDIDTADDALHARCVFVTGGTLTLSSGDDAVHADELADLRNVTLDVVASYEGVDAEEVHMANIWARIHADDNGVDAGEAGFAMDDGTLILYAPRAFGSDGSVSLGGTVTAECDGTKSPVRFVTAEVPGSLLLACTAGGSSVVLADGELPVSLLFVLPSDVPADTAVTLSDAAGAVLFSTSTTTDGGAFLFAGGGLAVGQTCTLTAGDYTASAVLTDGCTVTSGLSASGEASGETGRDAS